MATKMVFKAPGAGTAGAVPGPFGGVWGSQVARSKAGHEARAAVRVAGPEEATCSRLRF